jgi:hypothetical protein
MRSATENQFRFSTGLVGHPAWSSIGRRSRASIDTVILEQNVTPFAPARRRAPVLLQSGRNRRPPDPAQRSIAAGAQDHWTACSRT